MTKVLLLLEILFTLSFSASAAGITPDQKKRWREALGSQDYGVRVEAMNEIWETGEEALSLLEELSENEDPEIAARASVLTQKLLLGITPDTSGKVLVLIDQYLESAPRGRVAVLEQLRSLEEFDLILRLRRVEKSDRVVSRMDAMISQYMPRIVRGYLNDEKYDEAKEILGLSDKYDHIIRLGHLLDVTGGLDQELERLRQGDSVGNSRRYLGYLRVKGDAGLLRKEARRLGDRSAEVIAALVEGDFEPYFKYLLEIGKLGLPVQNYIKWTLADHKGDTEAKKKAYESILYLSKQEGEERDARMNLFRMGRGKEVVERLGDGYLAAKISYFLMQEEYLNAQNLIEVPEALELEGWIASLSLKVEEELQNEGRGVETDRMISAVEFLEGRGRIDDAKDVALALFDAAREKPEISHSALAREIYFSAPLSVVTAVAREIEGHDATASVFLGEMLYSDQEHIWVFNLLGEMMPKISMDERLALTCSFSNRHLLVSPEKYDEVFERVVLTVLKSEEALDGLKKLFQILQYRNRESELVRICEEQSKLGFDSNFLRYLIALDGGRIDDAIDNLERVEFQAETVSSVFMMQKGLAFKLAGKKGWKEMIERARVLSSGTVKDLEAIAAQQLQVGFIGESHQSLREALLRSEVVPLPGDYSGIDDVIAGLSAGAATLRHWREALAYREVAAVTSSYAGVTGGIFLMRDRFQVLVAQGAVAMEEGDIAGAVTAFSEAHRILPRDGYLANELFPVLREVGLIELHDQLFAQSAEYAREVIRRFPKDDNAYNNFAWLASRANRCLEEAEAYLMKALEMKPQSAAYLDTMGEIHFARKDRGKALKWSALALKNEVLGRATSRWELHQQRRRFQSGGFPVR
ncbi:hypothetical protein N9012_02960 [Akkermansiaceae bacterium]|nr:hypothetical protein [Akkermansiaceae bacterium]